VKGLRRSAIGIAVGAVVLTSVATYVANSGASAPTSAPTVGRVIQGQGSSGLGPIQNLAGPNAAGQSQVFYISGNVSGLYPGSGSTLHLSVQNPLGSPMTINTITIVAGSPMGCPSSNLVVPGTPPWTLNNTYTIHLALYVPASSTVAGPSVPISLVPGATNACSGAAFPLIYGGTATG
jgi:hypothetical protein